MSWITNIFKGYRAALLYKSDAISYSSPLTTHEGAIRNTVVSEVRISLNRCYDSVSGVKEWLSLPEVFFPINFIASRVAGAHFEIRRNSDDAIVWCANRSNEAKGLARLLAKPNWLQSWYEFTYAFMVQHLLTGNGFIRAAMSADVFNENSEKWRWCDALWSIPTEEIQINTFARGGLFKIFGCESADDVIDSYTIKGQMQVPYWQILHSRDLFADTGEGNARFLFSPSRLFSSAKNITILNRVYDARNTIYDKCGALGIITNRATDEMGSRPMSPEDKKEIHDHYNQQHGVGEGKSPTLITNANVDYLKTGADITQLQPYESMLADAIAIAGIYGIPSVLVPRKDQSTFNNHASAEKAVYTSVIIPLCEKFCEMLTNFLGLKDYYLSCNFDGVDCLQQGRKEEEQVKKLTNDRCRQQFIDGLISFNDWRAQSHESALEGEVFGKLRVEMTPEEWQTFAYIEKSTPKPSNTINLEENGEDQGSCIDDKDQ